MFGISFAEIVIVGMVALVFLGPQRLAVAAVSAGKLCAQLRRSYEGFLRELTQANQELRAVEASGNAGAAESLQANLEQDLMLLNQAFTLPAPESLHPLCPDTPRALAQLQDIAKSVTTVVDELSTPPDSVTPSLPEPSPLPPCEESTTGSPVPVKD